MAGFKPEECIACDRCGSFIPKILTKYHQCMGSDKTKRPANIPLERWLTVESKILDGALFEEYMRELAEDEPTHPRIKIVEVPTYEFNYKYAAISFIIGGLLGCLLFYLAR